MLRERITEFQNRKGESDWDIPLKNEFTPMPAMSGFPARPPPPGHAEVVHDCKQSKAIRDEPLVGGGIIKVICTAQVEILHVLLAVATCEMGL